MIGYYSFSLCHLANIFLQCTSPRFGCDVIMTSRNPYDAHHGVVINRAKFDVCTFSSLRGVIADRQTNRQTVRQTELRFIYQMVSNSPVDLCHYVVYFSAGDFLLFTQSSLVRHGCPLLHQHLHSRPLAHFTEDSTTE